MSFKPEHLDDHSRTESDRTIFAGVLRRRDFVRMCAASVFQSAVVASTRDALIDALRACSPGSELR